jgi:AcrR family transcriptional regulator
MGNAERNSYVTKAITKAAISLLRSEDLVSLTVSRICQEAQVSRNSFYRNFSSVEDILHREVTRRLRVWREAYDSQPHDSEADRYGSFFAHLQANADYYLLLERRGIFHIFREAYLGLFGPKPDQPNAEAYVVAFVGGGMLAWVEEWMARGMQESGDQMAAALRAADVR